MQQKMGDFVFSLFFCMLQASALRSPTLWVCMVNRVMAELLLLLDADDNHI